MTIFFTFFLLFFVVLSLAVSLVILAQESQTSGMGATFGGSDGASQLLGATAIETFRRVTTYLITAFLFSALLLTAWTGHQDVTPLPEKQKNG